MARVASALALLIFFCSSSLVQAQNEYDVWHFGQSSVLDFRPGTPATSRASAINQLEGCASICSRTTGQVLFYTDGVTVWDRNNAAMPNGQGLRGHNTSTQSALIIPVPCDTNRYYVITSDQQGYEPGPPPQGVHYSIVDMRLRGGLGDVTATKNVLIQNPASERLTAVAHANGYDSWLLTHSRGGRTFHAWRVTSTGISPTAVTSTLGLDQGATNGAGIQALGLLKASPNGRKLAMTTWTLGSVELFDFNPSTGVVSNPILAYQSTAGLEFIYGVTFSPDNTKLYHAISRQLHQYDLTTWTQGAITASRQQINPIAALSPMGITGAFQIGPDDKIYVVASGGWLGVINNPNVQGQACSYDEAAYFYTLSGAGWFGLPNNIDAKAANVSGGGAIRIDTSGPLTFCEPGSVTLTAQQGFATYLWSDGSQGTSITVTQAGTYTVTATDASGCIYRASIDVNVAPKPNPVITGPTTFCEGDSAVLRLTQQYERQVWSTSDTSRQITVRRAGTYRVTVTNEYGCTGDTSITVTMNPRPTPTISGTLAFCPGDSTTLDAGPGYASYRWSTGDTTQRIVVRSAGRFRVTVTNSFGCEATSPEVETTLFETPDATITASATELCEGDSARLSGRSGYARYLWSTGETTPSIVARTMGTYRLEVVNDNGCRDTAEITIVVNPNPRPTIAALRPLEFCDGDSTILDAGPGYASYLWSNGERTKRIVVKESGRFSVEVTDRKGCRGATGETQVNVNPLPDADIAGARSACPASTTSYLTDANAGSIYLWRVSGGTIVAGQGTSAISVRWGGIGSGRVDLTITNEFGCSDTASLDVEVRNDLKPTITPNRDPRLCEGDSVVLDAGDGFASYAWSTGETTRRITVRTAGSYTVRVVDAGGCSGTSDPMVVIVNPSPRPQIAVGDTTLCAGEVTTLDAGAGYAAYRWSNGATTRTIEVSQGGRYSVTVTDANGCSGTSAPVSVTVTPLPRPDVDGPRLVCRQALVEYATASLAGHDYVWSVSGGTILSGQGSSSIFVKWGDGPQGEVNLAVYTPEGCRGDAATVAVIVGDVLEPLIAVEGNSLLCDGDSTVLDAGPGYDRYEWSTGERTRRIVVRSSGRFTVRVEDATGCAGTSKEVVIETNPAPTPSIAGSRVELCRGESTTLEAPEGYASYRWSTGEVTRRIAVSRMGVYTVEVTDTNGCRGISRGDTVIVHELPARPTLTARGDTLVASDARAWQWSTGGIEIPGATSREYVVVAPGSYTVTITDSNGCRATSDPVLLMSGHIAWMDTVRTRVGGETHIAMRISPPLTAEENVRGFTASFRIDPRSLYAHEVVEGEHVVTGGGSYRLTRGNDGALRVERSRDAAPIVGDVLFRLRVEGLSTGVPENPVEISSVKLRPPDLPGNGLFAFVDSVTIVGPGLVLLDGCDIDHGFTFGRSASLKTITPNPATTTVTIAWRAPKGSYPELALVDILGNDIEVFALGEASGEIEKREISVRDLPSGMYVVQVRNGGEMVMGRLLVTH